MMAIHPISPDRVVSDSSHVNPVVNPQDQTATTSASASPQKIVQAANTDTVTISNQALQKLSQPYSPAEEAKESPVQKGHEKIIGRR